VIGPDTEAKGEMKNKSQYFQNQIAKTAAAFLGELYGTDKNAGDVVKAMITLK
jgi:hypothetical protein